MNKNSKLDKPDILAAIFFPRQEDRTPLPENSIDFDVNVDSATKIGCRFFIVDSQAPNILFFHGNGETTADYDTIGPMYNEVGVNFLVTDFRGYGWSSGSPSVGTMLADAEILYLEITDWLKANNQTGPLFLMGRSLGSVCAIDLAAIHNDNIKGLIIESGFADTLPLAVNLGIDIQKHDIKEEDCFNNNSKIEKVTKPTFILHGAKDQLIPAQEAEKLQALSGARSKEFQIVPGADHNSLIAVAGHLYFQTIKQFIDKITGATNWRKMRRNKKNKT